MENKLFERLSQMNKSEIKNYESQTQELHSTKNNFVDFKDNVSKEIIFLKGELGKIKQDTVSYFTNMKEKTDHLEQYLDASHEDLNRKYESIVPYKSEFKTGVKNYNY